MEVYISRMPENAFLARKFAENCKPQKLIFAKKSLFWSKFSMVKIKIKISKNHNFQQMLMPKMDSLAHFHSRNVYLYIPYS